MFNHGPRSVTAVTWRIRDVFSLIVEVESL